MYMYMYLNIADNLSIIVMDKTWGPKVSFIGS